MTLEDGTEGCPEVSVINHQSMLRNISEERRSFVHRGTSLQWINSVYRRG